MRGLTPLMMRTIGQRVRGIGAVALLTAFLAVATTASARAAPRASVAPQAGCANRKAVFKDRNPAVGVTDSNIDAGTDPLADCSLGQMAVNHVGYLRETLGWGGLSTPRTSTTSPALTRSSR